MVGPSLTAHDALAQDLNQKRIVSGRLAPDWGGTFNT